MNFVSLRAAALLAAVAFAPAAFTSADPITLGQKAKVDGIITGRAGDTMTVKTAEGDVVAVLTSNTDVSARKGKLGLIRKDAAATALIPGLKVGLEGVGDEKGRVGFGHGKAREVPEAIRKATEAAKRGLIRVPLREGRTLHHDVAGRHGAGRVYLRAAPPGTGIIAGGPMRAVFETLGMQDVVAKSLGSSNPYNMVRATFDALKRQDSPRSVAARRNIKVSALQARRREEQPESEQAAD